MTKRKACPKCQAKGNDKHGDNLVIHPEHNYAKCFKCDYFESITGIIKGTFVPIVDRGLTKEICEKYDIQIISYTGKFYPKKDAIDVVDHRCAAFNYHSNKQPEKQKLRSMSNKEYMTMRGNTKFNGLFGKQAFKPTKSWPIVITEGEWDAASVFQATGVPAVSLPNGAGSAAKTITEELEWLQQWKHVILLFDNDEAGKIATDVAIDALPVGTAYLAKMSEKDANDMLIKGKSSELKSSLWNAQPYRPNTIVTVEDILNKITIKPEYGLTLPWDFLNQGMYGIQPNHLYTFIGFSKVGKTEIIKEIMYHLIEKENEKIGIFSLEQGAASTVQRMVASFVKHPLHLPSNTWWDKETIETKAMEFNDKIYLYDNSSNTSLTLESLLINIRYMYFCFGIKVIILDNLTAMCTNPLIDGKVVSDETFIAHIMKKLFSLTRELPIAILLVAHIFESKLSRQIHIPTSEQNKASYLSIDETEMDELINKSGLDWASGRMPGLSDVNKMVGRMSDYVIGLARNIVSKNESVRCTLKLKFLATRLGSEYSGKEMKLIYNYHTGRYTELIKRGINDETA